DRDQAPVRAEIPANEEFPDLEEQHAGNNPNRHESQIGLKRSHLSPPTRVRMNDEPKTSSRWQYDEFQHGEKVSNGIHPDEPFNTSQSSLALAENPAAIDWRF